MSRRPSILRDCPRVRVAALDPLRLTILSFMLLCCYVTRAILETGVSTVSRSLRSENKRYGHVCAWVK